MRRGPIYPSTTTADPSTTAAPLRESGRRDAVIPADAKRSGPETEILREHLQQYHKSDGDEAGAIAIASPSKLVDAHGVFRGLVLKHFGYLK
eukprot:1191667-Prorocentrum_minimum.AAC.1